jgi:phosphoribosylformimino-5-aminoimidazole carboxamide ribotide isomerase
MTEPNYDATAALLSSTGPRIIASGGVSKTEQLLILARRGIHGAVVGRALYTGDISLPAALNALASEAL